MVWKPLRFISVTLQDATWVDTGRRKRRCHSKAYRWRQKQQHLNCVLAIDMIPGASFPHVRSRRLLFQLRWCYTGQLATPTCMMIRCCAKNHSSVTARWERFFAIFAVLQRKRVASFWKRFKSVTCLQISARNMRCESALQVGVASWPV